MNTHSLNRKERDKQLRRADILKAAEHVFAKKGYGRATMQDIAKEAQYATGTVYLYFEDKESLYFSLLEGKISSMMSIIKKKHRKLKTPEKNLIYGYTKACSFLKIIRIFFTYLFRRQVNFVG